MSGAEPEILIETSNGLGRITLNRPRAINALNHTMVQAMAEALLEWSVDDSVHAVLVTGAGERGLCAGGDIVSIHHDAKTGGTGSREFWRDEYILNAAIGRYPKPYVAIMDGIVMGGGIGISAHGSVRIVTERSSLAMPEVGIGFVPDVGGTYLLSRAPGELGTHVALTAGRMTAGDAIALGFADHFVPSDLLDKFVDALGTGTVDDAVGEYCRPAPESTLLAQRHWIDAAYSADTVEEIIAALRGTDIDDAHTAADTITAKSPVAVKVTLRSLRHARRLDTLEEVLDEEFRVSVAALGSHDLVEGIRAQVIDKDRRPAWNPPALADVTAADVDAYFQPLGDLDLGLAAPEGDV